MGHHNRGTEETASALRSRVRIRCCGRRRTWPTANPSRRTWRWWWPADFWWGCPKTCGGIPRPYYQELFSSMARGYHRIFPGSCGWSAACGAPEHSSRPYTSPSFSRGSLRDETIMEVKGLSGDRTW